MFDSIKKGSLHTSILPFLIFAKDFHAIYVTKKNLHLVSR